jgi:hypothetical protein
MTRAVDWKALRGCIQALVRWRSKAIAPGANRLLQCRILGYLLPSELTTIERGKRALSVHKLGKCAVLDNTPIPHHQDHVGALDGGQTMGDDEGRTASRELLKSLHNQRFGGRVQR